MMKAKGRRSVYYMNGSGISMITFDDVTSDNFFRERMSKTQREAMGSILL